ncbi:MAG TPA: DUF6644 family protein [Xanthobacteraceae bacterium]|nr:DUF6644 family protein [Xanthobacteraceae bacterium]
MEHQAPALFVALEGSGLAAAIRQSLFLYPLANVGHIVALVCFAGAIAVMDLRLVGAFAATVPALVIARARRVVIAALCVLAVTGFMLFAAEASHVVLNPVFQLKMALVAVGLVNVAIYEWGAQGAVYALPAGAAMPRRARIAGFISLGLWLAVAACGRSIAYF